MKLTLLSIYLIISFKIFASQVAGIVRDAETGEVLIGVNIWEQNQKKGTATDNKGYFNMVIKTPAALNFSFVGYKSQKIELSINNDTTIFIQMISDNALSEVVVYAQKTVSEGVTHITGQQLMNIPAIGGKPDLIKVLQLLPGVQASSEGMSQMLVRGGDPGQNKYMIDNVPLIYVNHLGGLFSVFNPDMINAVDFYKGNFPAREGGKLSSIVDITHRKGDKTRHKGSYGFGLTEASAHFEGPFKNKKATYLVTARKTLIDALMAAFSATSGGNDAILWYGFHDINAKISYQADDKNAFSFNFYQGDDYFNFFLKPWEYDKDERMRINQKWGNYLFSSHWNSMLTSKTTMENIVSFCRYRNKTVLNYEYTDSIKNTMRTEHKSAVSDLSFRSMWKTKLANYWYMEYGMNSAYVAFQPIYNYSSLVKDNQPSAIYSTFDGALYLDNTIWLGNHLSLQPGVRLTNFSNNGTHFLQLEPRASLTVKFNNQQKLNFNYVKMSQSSHLIYAQSELLRREIWLPSTKQLPPALSNQVSASWMGIFGSGLYSTETNIYYKEMENLVTLKEGYENMIGAYYGENMIIRNGKGKGYGAEFTVSKNGGKLTGSASYTLSYADRYYSQINNGVKYEYEYNRPHSITINMVHKMNKGWNASAVWFWQSGSPYTPILGKYPSLDNSKTEISGLWKDVQNIYFHVGEKNSARMQPYHRLDVAFNRTLKTRKGNTAIWTLSFYNTYNRINPSFYYYDDDSDSRNEPNLDRALNHYKKGFFSIIPSLSYKVNFDMDGIKPAKTIEYKQEKKLEKKKRDKYFL